MCKDPADLLLFHHIGHAVAADQEGIPFLQVIALNIWLDHHLIRVNAKILCQIWLTAGDPILLHKSGICMILRYLQQPSASQQIAAAVTKIADPYLTGMEIQSDQCRAGLI